MDLRYFCPAEEGAFNFPIEILSHFAERFNSRFYSEEVSKRGKPYAQIELLRNVDRYEQVLESIEALPEPFDELLPVAENQISILYGSDDENAQGI